MTILKVLSWTLVWRHLLNICRAGSSGAGSSTMSFGMRKKIHDQVRALQGVMMSGVALWTTDIGGYSGGDPKDPLFQVVWILTNVSSLTPKTWFLMLLEGKQKLMRHWRYFMRHRRYFFLCWFHYQFWHCLIIQVIMTAYAPWSQLTSGLCKLLEQRASGFMRYFGVFFEAMMQLRGSVALR